VMIDSMRGRAYSWTRIRINLRNVPEDERPEQEALEVDYDPWDGVEWPENEKAEERAEWRRRRSGRAQAGGDSPS
jgi:hypothetical protein